MFNLTNCLLEEHVNFVKTRNSMGTILQEMSIDENLVDHWEIEDGKRRLREGETCQSDLSDEDCLVRKDTSSQKFKEDTSFSMKTTVRELSVHTIPDQKKVCFYEQKSSTLSFRDEVLNTVKMSDREKKFLDVYNNDLVLQSSNECAQECWKNNLVRGFQRCGNYLPHPIEDFANPSTSSSQEFYPQVNHENLNPQWLFFPKKNQFVTQIFPKTHFSHDIFPPSSP